jgi:outer membrane protein OmpA-like peptidoglycan-associated protein
MMPKRRVLMAALAAAYLPILVQAADPSPDESTAVLSGQQIEQALQQPRTRSFAPRGLTRRDAPEAEQSVNLNIPFDHNSSTLGPQAAAQLKELELALSSASLGKDRFVVAGHTDAKGSAQYNKQLSLRRAEAVKRFLVAKG